MKIHHYSKEKVKKKRKRNKNFGLFWKVWKMIVMYISASLVQTSDNTLKNWWIFQKARANFLPGETRTIFLNREIPPFLGRVSIFLIGNLLTASVNLFRYITLISPTKLSSGELPIDNTTAPKAPLPEDFEKVRRLILRSGAWIYSTRCFHRTDGIVYALSRAREDAVSRSVYILVFFGKRCRCRKHVCVFIREIGDVFVPDSFKKRQHHQHRLSDAL